MKRFLREAAIPIIIATSYAGYELAHNEQVRGFVNDARSRIERILEEHRENQAIRGATIRDAFSSYVTNMRVSRDLNRYVPEPGVPSSPEITLARPENTTPLEPYEADTIAMIEDPPARAVSVPEKSETNHIPLARADTREKPFTQEPSALEHVIETIPVETFGYDEWQTSTIARMHVLEPEIERLAQRFNTDASTVYATLIVESSLDPIARNEEDDKYGLAQIRPSMLESLTASETIEVSLLDPIDNLNLYTTLLSWIEEETGLHDFVTLNAIHSRTGPLVTLEAFLGSDDHSRYQGLVDARVPHVRALIDACDSPNDPDLDAICSINGTVAQRYRRLFDASIERASATSGMRSAIHYANAVLSLRSLEEIEGARRSASRLELEALFERIGIEGAYSTRSLERLDESIGERYTIREP